MTTWLGMTWLEWWTLLVPTLGALYLIFFVKDPKHD